MGASQNPQARQWDEHSAEVGRMRRPKSHNARVRPPGHGVKGIELCGTVWHGYRWRGSTAGQALAARLLGPRITRVALPAFHVACTVHKPPLAFPWLC